VPETTAAKPFRGRLLAVLFVKIVRCMNAVPAGLAGRSKKNEVGFGLTE